MVLAFYKVNNSRNYTRHTFDTMDVETKFKKLNLLKDDEWWCVFINA